MPPVNVTVWNEFIHERQNVSVARIPPFDLHEAIAGGVSENSAVHVLTAMLDPVDPGFPPARRSETNVRHSWERGAHDAIETGRGDRVLTSATP